LAQVPSSVIPFRKPHFLRDGRRTLRHILTGCIVAPFSSGEGHRKERFRYSVVREDRGAPPSRDVSAAQNGAASTGAGLRGARNLTNL